MTEDRNTKQGLTPLSETAKAELDEEPTVVGRVRIKGGLSISHHVFYRNDLPDGDYDLLAVKSD